MNIRVFLGGSEQEFGAARKKEEEKIPRVGTLAPSRFDAIRTRTKNYKR